MSEEDFVGNRLRIGRWLPSNETTGCRRAATGFQREPVPDEPAEIGPVVSTPAVVEAGDAGSGEWSRPRWTLVAATVSLTAMLLVGASVGQWTDGAPAAGGGPAPGAQAGGQANATSPSPGVDASSPTPGTVRPQPDLVGHAAESRSSTAGERSHEAGVAYPSMTVGARIG